MPLSPSEWLHFSSIPRPCRRCGLYGPTLGTYSIYPNSGCLTFFGFQISDRLISLPYSPAAINAFQSYSWFLLNIFHPLKLEPVTVNVLLCRISTFMSPPLSPPFDTTYHIISYNRQLPSLMPFGLNYWYVGQLSYSSVFALFIPPDSPYDIAPFSTTPSRNLTTVNCPR
jgi:hypothetical protein